MTGQDHNPILVLGDARRDALRARLCKTVEDWLADWAAANTPYDVEVDIETADASACATEGGSSGLLISASVDGDEQLAMWAPVNLLERALGATTSSTARAANARHAKISQSLTETCCWSLINEIASAANLDLRANGESELCTSPNSNTETSRARRNWWRVNVSLGLSSGGIRLELSSRLIDRLVPRAGVGTKGRLDSRRSAIADEKVRLQVVLGEASVSMGDLAALGIDDVIVLSDEYSRSSYLAGRNGEKVAAISLGRVGDKRAAVVIK